MEIKAILYKPYTEEEKEHFIINESHRKGFDIVETETSIESWGRSEQDIFEEFKQKKYVENDNKAKTARINQEFSVVINEVELFFDTTRDTQQDLSTAKDFLSAGAEKYDWWDNKGTYFSFTNVEQILEVSMVFMEKANIYPIWAYYKNLIDKTTTIRELEQIDINYNINLGDNDDIIE